MSAVFQFRVLKINDPRPDFLHDFVHNDSYLTNGTTFRLLHGCFTILQNCTIMGQIIDRELGEPHIGCTEIIENHRLCKMKMKSDAQKDYFNALFINNI